MYKVIVVTKNEAVTCMGIPCEVEPPLFWNLNEVACMEQNSGVASRSQYPVCVCSFIFSLDIIFCQRVFLFC